MLGNRAAAFAFLLVTVGGTRADVAPAPPPQPVGQQESDAFQRCAGKPEITQCYLAAGLEIVETRPGEAAALFLAAYRIEAKIDPLASYGLAMAADGKFIEAAEALEKAVEEYDKLSVQFAAEDKSAQGQFGVLHRIKAVKDALVRLGPNIGWVQIALPPGVTVVRKGATDLRPSNPTRIVVKAKGDTLVFTYASGRTLEQPVIIAGGALSTLDVPAEPPPETTKVEAEPPPPPVDHAAALHKRSYIAGGVGGVLVIGGVVTLLASDLAPLGGGLIGLGVVGLGLSGYWFYKAETLPVATKNAMLVPNVTPDGVGAALIGRF